MHQAVEQVSKDELRARFEAYYLGRRAAHKQLPCRPPKEMENIWKKEYRRGWWQATRTGN